MPELRTGEQTRTLPAESEKKAKPYFRVTFCPSVRTLLSLLARVESSCSLFLFAWWRRTNNNAIFSQKRVSTAFKYLPGMKQRKSNRALLIAVRVIFSVFFFLLAATCHASAHISYKYQHHPEQSREDEVGDSRRQQKTEEDTRSAGSSIFLFCCASCCKAHLYRTVHEPAKETPMLIDCTSSTVHGV